MEDQTSNRTTLTKDSMLHNFDGRTRTGVSSMIML